MYTQPVCKYCGVVHDNSTECTVGSLKQLSALRLNSIEMQHEELTRLRAIEKRYKRLERATRNLMQQHTEARLWIDDDFWNAWNGLKQALEDEE